MNPQAELTEREEEVLEQVAAGLTNRQIARELAISRHTVRTHLRAIYLKLGNSNRTAVAVMYVKARQSE